MLAVLTLTLITIIVAIEVVILRGLGALRAKNVIEPTKGSGSGQTSS